MAHEAAHEQLLAVRAEAVELRMRVLAAAATLEAICAQEEASRVKALQEKDVDSDDGEEETQQPAEPKEDARRRGPAREENG